MRAQLLFTILIIFLWLPLQSRSLDLNAAGDVGNILTLAQAERLALHNNAALDALAAKVRTHEFQSVAAGELPEPMASVGLLALPLDTFDLDQENMTRIQVGVAQSFPASGVRSLRSEVALNQGQIARSRQQLQRREILHDVRRAYWQTVGLEMTQTVLSARQQLIDEEIQTRQILLETSSAQQASLLAAQLERSKIATQLSSLLAQEHDSRARLSRWIGDAALRPVSSVWPDPFAAALVDLPDEQLLDHPQLRVVETELQHAQSTYQLARAEAKSGYTVELGYGKRFGDSPLGRDKPDLLSATVRMDLPWARPRKTDNRIAAAAAGVDQVLALQKDTYQKLRAKWHGMREQAIQLSMQIQLYKDQLMPQARDLVAAQRNAYESGLVLATAPIDARKQSNQFELELRRLETELQLLLADIYFLMGEQDA